MNILVTGLTTLHWGRLEYGNIGNYYIIVPLFRGLHRTFPEATISTTLQLTEDFAKRERIKVLPLDLYYGWRDNHVDTTAALQELGIAQLYSDTGHLLEETAFITEVMRTDLIIDFSGDMWGDNSERMGENRFLVELLKIRTAQLLGKKTVLFASSPGPVTNEDVLELAKTVYANYVSVINRESYSIAITRPFHFSIV